MATGTVPLPLIGGTADPTNPPGVDFVNGQPKLLFDAATPQLVRWTFRMPENYASAPVLKIQYAMASATTGSVDTETRIMAVTPGDAQDTDADSYDSVNSQADAAVPGTAGYLDEISVTLTNADGLAAGDFVVIEFSRDADDATNDTAAGDMEVRSFALEYTTS